MVRLFASTPDAPQAQAFAAYIRRVSGKDVEVLPFSALTSPDAKLRAELHEAENRLTQIQHMLGVGEKHAPRYDAQLPQLRRDQERHQQLIAELKRRLGGEGGQPA
ncbi:hypothetical protein GCM10027048_20130 [Hymenobacter coalescens]